MTDQEELKLAEKIATELHAGQFRRDGVTPYIEHPKAVADKLDYPRLKPLAWLHDVIEDCDIDERGLIDMGIDGTLAFKVGVLSRKAGQSYDDYMRRIKCYHWARSVKMADMLTNLTDSPTPKQVEKYTKAIMYLIS